MKKRKNKNKKKRRLYIILLILVYLSSFFITIKYSISKKSILISYSLKDNIYINKNSNNNNKIITKLVSYIASVDLNNPISFINNNYTDDSNRKIEDNYVKDPYPKQNINKPIVYLYNTHQQETYKKLNNSSYNVSDTVMTLSYILREKLNKKGINTIVEENNISEFLKTNNWNYASSYKVSRILLNNIIEKEPSLKYFIDLHRDSVSREISTINIDNKNYAKVLFIIGLENPNYKDNLAITEKLNNMINNRYSGLSRGIYKKEGKGVNGVYNQDFNKNTILIEVGAEKNTIDEVNNTAEVLANILYEYIRGEYEK